MNIIRNTAASIAALLALAGGTASAQSLTVLPVSVQMAPGQLSTTLTVINQGDTETAVQVRVFTWDQTDGDDHLVSSDQVLTSPPLATIAPGSAQVVRLVLRQPPQGKEIAYRILLDQIPPPADPGTVRVALRVSIPVFALPKAAATPRISYRVVNQAGQSQLIAVNAGGRHEAIRDISLVTADGRTLQTEANASPYILAGATRRWAIVGLGAPLAPGSTVRLKGSGVGGAVDQAVVVGP